MPIAYSGIVSKKEYTAALQMHFDRTLKWVKIAFGIILAILIVALVFMIATQPDISAALFPGIIFPVILLSFPWWIPILQAASYNQAGNIYRAPVHGAIDETGISVNNQNIQAKFLWNTFGHSVKKGEIVLLYQGKNSFNIFTKSMFQSPADWEAFLALLQAKNILSQ